MLVEIEMHGTGERVGVEPALAGRLIRGGRAHLVGPIFRREDMIAVLGHDLRMVRVSAGCLHAAGV